MVKEVIILIERLLEINNVGIVKYQEKESTVSLVSFCIYALEKKMTMIKYVTNKNLLFLLHKTISKEYMTFCKFHKFCEMFILPYGCLNGKETIPKKGNLNTKKASDREKRIYL